MKIDNIRFFRTCNIRSASSGSLISLSNVDPNAPVDFQRVVDWLKCLPVSLNFNRTKSQDQVTWLEAFYFVLVALTEHVRLSNETQPIKTIDQTSDAFSVWLQIDDASAAEAATFLTCHALSSVLNHTAPNSDTLRLWTKLRMRFWNQTHAHLARAAQDMGVPFYRIDLNGQQFLQLGQGVHLRLFRETVTDQTALFAKTGADKYLLHSLLRNKGVPLPAQEAVETLDQALAAAEKIRWPVVLKPVASGKGKGVWVGLSGPSELRQAWQANAAGANNRQLVQQTLSGFDHRLLVVDGQLMAVAQRQPAMLICDGRSSLHEQITALNADPQRGVGYERLMNKVPVDERLGLLLHEQGFEIHSIPPAGTNVQLSRTANISQGGLAIDHTESIHPDNRRLAEDIAKLLGADVTGLDMMSRDIRVSWRQGGTWLLEANLSPGLRPHLVANPSTDLCHRMVGRWMGSNPKAGRIPTALITGSIGKTTTTRMLAHLLKNSGLRVGLTSTMGIEFDGDLIVEGDCAGGAGALRLLQDRRSEAVVAEIARGGILKSGIGLRRSDVAAVLNVLDNHVGIDGVQSRDDLARVKAQVAQTAETLLALNADDPLVLQMGKNRPEHQVALVSENPSNTVWQAHRDAGHLSVLFSMKKDGSIQAFNKNQQVLHVQLEEIPASQGGTVGPIAAAAAYSSALALGLGLDVNQIHSGLLTFGTESRHTRGRFEVISHSPCQVVLTWADGAQAMAALSEYAMSASESFTGRRVLLFSAPDNRPDHYLKQMGQETWGFDVVICASWDRRRGREPDEVSRLLAEGASLVNATGREVTVGGVESEAVKILQRLMQPEDLCVISSFASEHVKQLIKRR